MAAAKELKRMLQHRPLFPESQSFKDFEALKERHMAALKAQYPAVCVEQLF